MNTNTIIGIVVAILIVLGLGYYFFSGSMGTNTITEPTQGSTFASILAAGANVQCDFTHSPEAGQQTSGRMYVANNGQNIRGSFTVSGDEPMQAEMLRTGDYHYMWGPSMPQGVKMRVTEENRGKLFESSDNTEIPEDVTYTCSPWTVDESMFAVPTNIEFLELGAGIPQMDNLPESGAPSSGMNPGSGVPAGSGADLKAMQCAACNQAPDAESRAQCLQALSCPM